MYTPQKGLVVHLEGNNSFPIVALLLEKYACLSSHNATSNRPFNNLNLGRMTQTTIGITSKSRRLKRLQNI